MAKQVCDIKPTKGISAADSKEQTRTWSTKQMELRLGNKDLNYDFTRTHLNFEIVDGEIKEVNKDELLDDSIRNNLKRRGIPHPEEAKSHVKKGQSEPKKKERIIAARMILGGSTERMNEIAFGTQKVDFRKGADNSHVKRTATFDEWAMDEYNYLERFYGKGSVARFIVHLDESWPHIHATIIPTAQIKGRERVSWRTVFGGSLDVSRPKWDHIHDEHYNQVGKKWGLDRGTPINISGAKHRSTRDYHKDLERDNSILMQQNEEAERKLSAITSRTEQLEKEMGKHIKAMKSLTSMIENKTTEKNNAVLGLQIAQGQYNSGEISVDEYEVIVADTNEKMAALNSFIAGKIDTLTKVAIQNMEKEEEFKKLHKDYDNLLSEVDAAQKYKKENDGLFKRMSSYLENRSVQNSISEIAKRLNLIPTGKKIDSSSELLDLLKDFSSNYQKIMSQTKQAGYKQGYAARNAEINPYEMRLRSIVISHGVPKHLAQNMTLPELTKCLEDQNQNKQKELTAAQEKGKAEGRKEAVDKFINSSRLNWKTTQTPESLGERYREKWENCKRLSEFEKEHGNLSEISKTFAGYESKIKLRDRKISELRSLMPTYQKAITAIIALFHNPSRSLSFTMEQTENIWRILSMASTKKECVNMANELVSMAKDADPNRPIEAWVNDAAQCVIDIAENVSPLAAVFSLIPDGVSVEGGGSNNELPRKKDDEYSQAKFRSIMGNSRRGRYR